MPITSPRSSTSEISAKARGRSAGFSRRIGIMPAPQNSHLVIQWSVYSAFPTKATGRGNANISSTESMNDVWLATMIAGPSTGS